MRMTLKDAEERYGKIDVESKIWPDQLVWMEIFDLPPDLIFQNWLVVGTTKPVTRLYCNKDMKPALLSALYNLKERGLQTELKTFDGLFNIRFVRGTKDRPSTHAYGLAIDINAAENKLGGAVNFTQAFIDCFTEAGFTWGGSFSRIDGMHFSWAWE